MPEVLSHGRENTLGGQYIQQFLFIGLIGQGAGLDEAYQRA